MECSLRKISEITVDLNPKLQRHQKIKTLKYSNISIEKEDG